MATSKSILIVGLTKEAVGVAVPKMDNDAYEFQITTSINTLDACPNLLVRRFDLDPSAPKDSPNSRDLFNKTVSQGPSPLGIVEWDIIMFSAGFGKMTRPKIEAFYDQIRKDVRVYQNSGGTRSLRLLFSQTDKDHWNVLKTYVPELQMGDRPLVLDKKDLDDVFKINYISFMV